MSSEIINRVEKSSLRTIDPDLFYQNIEVISFDLKPFLRDGLLLIEKDFRKSIEDHNWNQYTNKGVSIVCSNEAIVPDWAFMLVCSKLENLNITKGLIFSQEVMLELTKSGLTREQSYKMVQNYAKKCFAENLDLFDVISSDNLIMSKITPKKLKSMFSYAKHFKNVDFIFRRVFK